MEEERSEGGREGVSWDAFKNENPHPVGGGKNEASEAGPLGWRQQEFALGWGHYGCTKCMHFH